jgi:hypothetical protein
MKGKKAFIRAARRSSKPAQPAKVPGRIKVKAAELEVKQQRGPPVLGTVRYQPEVLAQAIVEKSGGSSFGKPPFHMAGA